MHLTLTFFSFLNRDKHFDEFSKHLKGLVNLYKLPGDKSGFSFFFHYLSVSVTIWICLCSFLILFHSKLKTKMYLALQSLELDLTKMMHMFRYTIFFLCQEKNISTVLCSSKKVLFWM